MNVTLTVGSLFSGIGGLDLGLERAGMTVIWQSEIDPYATRVLARHWPDVPNLGDITTIDWTTVERPDLICGGYPCQPFSLAGTRGGDTDPRHLWPRMRDAVRHLRPRYALLENVPGHLSLGFGRVLGDLAELGYDCEWDCIPAAAVGAPHLRYRIFVVAHTHGEGEPGVTVDAVTRPGVMVPDTSRDVVRHQPISIRRGSGQTVTGHDGTNRDVADTDVTGPQGHRSEHRLREDRPQGEAGRRSDVADTENPDEPHCRCLGSPERSESGRVGRSGPVSWWAVEPDVGRVAHGIPHRMDRLRTLGNAVVPQVAELIGRRILEQAAIP